MENLRAREIAYQQELAQMLYGRTVRLLETHGIIVVEEQRYGAGESHGGKITINETSQPIGKFATLIHEATHEAMHWNPDWVLIEPSATVRETHAEAVSCGVLYDFGIDIIPESAQYISLHGDFRILKRDQKLIRNVRDYFIQQLTSDASSNRVQAA